jgi:hypothetical protein
MSRQPTAYQFDLFFNPQNGKAPGMPRWQALPEGARKAVTGMMSRLILEHIDSDSAAQRDWRGRSGQFASLRVLIFQSGDQASAPSRDGPARFDC